MLGSMMQASTRCGPSRRAVVGALLAGVAAFASGCTHAEVPAAPERSPQQVLAAAQQKLDATSGVRIALRTNNLPAGTSGLTEAIGTATNAPAFEGTLKVMFGGSSVEVPMVAVAGKVRAQLPLTTGWSDIRPSDYGAPDPAAFVSKGAGFSSLLPTTSQPTRGATVRGGSDNSEVLTEYTGTVPGSAMKTVIPSASGDVFSVVYTVTASDELRTARFTGVFYPNSAPMTYSVTFDRYGTTKQITLP